MSNVKETPEQAANKMYELFKEILDTQSVIIQKIQEINEKLDKAPANRASVWRDM